nr:hypothetical protein [uncultured Actinomyces sp.]
MIWSILTMMLILSNVWVHSLKDLDEKYRNGFHAISCIVAAVALVIALITVR